MKWPAQQNTKNKFRGIGQGHCKDRVAMSGHKANRKLRNAHTLFDIAWEKNKNNFVKLFSFFSLTISQLIFHHKYYYYYYYFKSFLRMNVFKWPRTEFLKSSMVATGDFFVHRNKLHCFEKSSVILKLICIMWHHRINALQIICFSQSQ